LVLADSSPSNSNKPCFYPFRPSIHGELEGVRPAGLLSLSDPCASVEESPTAQEATAVRPLSLFCVRSVSRRAWSLEAKLLIDTSAASEFDRFP